MVNLVFTGIAERDPDVHVSDSRSAIATFPVAVKEQPHVQPTRIEVVAVGQLADYALRTIRKDSLVMISGWFHVEVNKKGNEFLEVKARHLRALIP